MKNLTTLLICLILAGCGGGGGGSSAPAKPQPPATSASAIVLSNAIVDVAGVGGDFLIEAASGVNVTVSGASNNVTFSQDQSASSIAINGNSNTIIIRPGCSATLLTVIGTGNIFWIPKTMTFIIDNPTHPPITLNIYTP